MRKRSELEYAVLPIAALQEFANNPRHHSKQQVRRLASSIDEFGFTNPILVDEANELIAGHGRIAAAKLLELTEVPVIRIRSLTPAQKRALRIADNRLAERSTWSMDLLAKELKDIINLEFDVELTGFDAIEVDGIVTIEPASAEEEGPIKPPPQQAVTKSGDLWQLGEHRILCGDSRETSCYERLLEGALADMVITDVPYNVPINGHVSGLGKNTHAEFAMASGEMTPEQFNRFLQLVLGRARDSSRDGSLHYVFIDWRSIADLVSVGRDLFAELKNVICWVKPNPAMGSLYRSQHELIAVFKHGRAKHVNNVQLGRMGRNRSNVWQYPGASGFSKSRQKNLEDHPTVKPIRLVADAIRDVTKPGDLVLDPFGGAGTTLLAADQVGRRGALIEIEPRYVDVTLRRFQEQTGTEARLLPELIPLNTVRAQRFGEAAR